MNAQGYGRIVLTSSSSGIYGNFSQTNYGAAKMGMLGMMNVLALEGASNVRVNTLAPAAATRMISTIPGRRSPKQPTAESAPSLVSPAVLYMTSEDAQTARSSMPAAASSTERKSTSTILWTWVSMQRSNH